MIVVYFCSYFLFAIKLKFMKKFMSLLITNKLFLMNLFGTKLVGDITFRNDVSSRFCGGNIKYSLKLPILFGKRTSKKIAVV